MTMESTLVQGLNAAIDAVRKSYCYPTLKLVCIEHHAAGLTKGNGSHYLGILDQNNEKSTYVATLAMEDPLDELHRRS